MVTVVRSPHRAPPSTRPVTTPLRLRRDAYGAPLSGIPTLRRPRSSSVLNATQGGASRILWKLELGELAPPPKQEQVTGAKGASAEKGRLSQGSPTTTIDLEHAVGGN